MLASILRTAVRSYADAAHEPQQLLNLVNRELWQAAAGSIGCAVLRPARPDGPYSPCHGGRRHGLISSARRLAVAIAVALPLARDPNTSYQPVMHALRPEETLLVMAGDDPQFTPPVKGRAHRLGLSSIARLVAEKLGQLGQGTGRRAPLPILVEQDPHQPRSHAVGGQTPPARLVVKHAGGDSASSVIFPKNRRPTGCLTTAS